MATTKDMLNDCGRLICHSFDILKAMIIRFCFALHATIAIIRIVIIKGDYWYLLNMCGVNLLLIELVVTIVKRKGLSTVDYIETKSKSTMRIDLCRKRTEMVTLKRSQRSYPLSNYDNASFV
jgi:hypothetical protein